MTLACACLNACYRLSSEKAGRECMIGKGLLESGEVYRRADGGVICGCGQEYRRHKVAEEYQSNNGHPWLVRLCNGALVKL